MNPESFVGAEILADRLACILDALPAGVVLVSENGLVVEANPAAREIYGNDISGKSWLELNAVLLKMQEDVMSNIPDNCDVLTIGARRVNIDTRRLCPEQGGGYVYLVHDVTASTLADFGQARLEKLAAIGNVAARCAHQIRTPLAAAMLDAGRIVSGRATANCAERLISQLRAVEMRVAAILRYVSGESSHRRRVNPQAVLYGLMVEIKPLFGAKAISLSHELENVESIDAPEDALVDVARSLLDNAMESGAKAVRVRLYYDHVKSCRFLSVEDNGPGIKNIDPKTIFEPFSTNKAHGTGLGLSIAMESAKSFNGQLKAENRQEGGARFTLKF